MNFKENFEKLLQSLGFTEKAKAKTLTQDDWKTIAESYKTTYGISLEEAAAVIGNEAGEDSGTQGAAIATEETPISAEVQAQILQVINTAAAATGGEPQKEAPANVGAAMQSFVSAMEKASETIRTLAAKPEPSKPLETIQANKYEGHAVEMIMGHSSHTPSHLFGIEEKFMATGKWWNDITVARKEVEVESLTAAQKTEFKKEFNAYANSFLNRSKELLKKNAYHSLDYNKMIGGTSPFTSLTELDENFGEFTVRRQDILLAYFRSLPSVESIFPVQSNVRNQEVIPTIALGELSQSYRKGHIFKGNVKFASEKYVVNQNMFKYEFDDMIRLQKSYVMNLSRNSDPIQWTFIEWIMIYFGKQLVNEENIRRVMGVYVPPQNVNSNPFVFGANGALRAIEEKENELKVLPFSGAELGYIYDSVTIVDYAENFRDLVRRVLPNMYGMKLYINEAHKDMYIRNYRKKYAQDNDFTGAKATLIDVEPKDIVWVPNMPVNCYKMWITTEGNVENLEYVPGEMLAFHFKEDFESVLVRSTWKGGAAVLQAGVKYKTISELTASKRANQWLFTNFPATELAGNATTVDGDTNNLFVTGANSAATAITDITNADRNRVYKIVAGDVGANKTTIAKAGKFAKIKSDWTPTAVGDYIELYCELADTEETDEESGITFKVTNPTGNFLELSRKVTTAPAV